MPRRESLALGFLAVGLFACHVFLALEWARSDRQPPGWDPAVHLGTALDYRQALAEGRWLDLLLTKSRPGHPPYPPAYHYTLWTVLGSERPHLSVVWPNLFYFLVLAGSAAWIAWQLGGAWPAAAVLLMAGLSPGLFYKFREAFPDLSLAAWVSLTYALILRSRLYERRGSSIAVGLAAGLAVASKWGAVLYLLPGWLAGLSDPRRRRHLAWATGTAALLCAPWYLVNGIQMLPRIWASVTLGHYQGQPLTWTFSNWWFYPGYLVDCFSWPGFLLLMGGCVWALKNAKRAQERGPRLVIAAWLGFSYLFCTLVPSKDTRYFLPAAPAAAALGAVGLPAPALAAAGALALAHARGLRRPQPEDWRAREMLRELESLRDRSREVSTLCILANHRNLNSTSMSWLARRAGLSRVSIGCQESEIPEWSDFVLLKTGDPGQFLAERTHRILSEAGRGDSLFSSVFRELRRWPLPDGSSALLYAQRRDLPLIARERRFPELWVKGSRLEGVRLKPLGAGRYEVHVATLTLAKLQAPIRGIRLALEGARLLEHQGKVYILGLGTATLLSARVSWEGLARALTARSGVPIAVSGADGAVSVRAKLGPLPVGLSFGLSAIEGSLALRVRQARLLGVPLPWASRLDFKRSLAPAPPYQPYALALAPIRLDGEGAWVNP